MEQGHTGSENRDSPTPKGGIEKAIEQVEKDIVRMGGTVDYDSSAYSKDEIVKRLIELDAVNNFPQNDKGSARLFAEVFKDESRYSPTAKDWMFYDGKKWARDFEGLKALSNAKRLADAMLIYIGSTSMQNSESYSKYVASLQKYNVRNTIVRDARDVNCFQSEDLDADDYLLNVQNGTIDLKSDPISFRKHDPDDLLSKCCNAEYDEKALCPLWEKTIREIMADDEEKTEYLQKLLGLCLTGITKDEKLHIFFGGTSRNGKSTITETILNILGDYGQTITPETLAIKTNKDSRSPSPDIAKLSGARMVIASEPPKRMQLDSSLVKTMTGRDRMTARFLQQNEFSFVPKFKLIMNTNYLPSISDPTVFMSERIRVVEFTVHFGEEDQDKDLKDKLKEESCGILNWMIEGYKKYKRDGLRPPKTIVEATESYAKDSDRIEMFINECLTESKGDYCKAGDAYQRYDDWTKDNGYGTESKSNFFSDLKAKNLFQKDFNVRGLHLKNVIPGYVIGNGDFEPLEDYDKTVFE